MASFLCSHESYILPSAQPIANTNIYPYNCERCVRREAEKAVKAIENRNKDSKDRLDNTIKAKMLLRDSPGFLVNPHWEEILMEINEKVLEKDKIEREEPGQITKAWKLHKNLYQGGAKYT